MIRVFETVTPLSLRAKKVYAKRAYQGNGTLHTAAHVYGTVQSDFYVLGGFFAQKTCAVL